jgi:hypothetical protein
MRGGLGVIRGGFGVILNTLDVILGGLGDVDILAVTE